MSIRSKNKQTLPCRYVFCRRLQILNVLASHLQSLPIEYRLADSL